jgi:hypothetical protein
VGRLNNELFALHPQERPVVLARAVIPPREWPYRGDIKEDFAVYMVE